MALVSITDAARLVRKAEATLARDIEKGSLKKTVLQDGDIRVDTNELARTYGQLHDSQPAAKAAPAKQARRASNDKAKIALLAERIRSLERIIVLEAELRRVKDQVTTELRARLSDKDRVIQTLENRIRYLEFEQQLHAVPTLDPADHPDSKPAAEATPPAPARHWWTRWFKPRPQKLS